MTKVLFIAIILAIGFGPTVYAVLHVLGHIARTIFKMVADRKAVGFLYDAIIGAAFGVAFAPDLGVKRYIIVFVALVAAFMLKRYLD